MDGSKAEAGVEENEQEEGQPANEQAALLQEEEISVMSKIKFDDAAEAADTYTGKVSDLVRSLTWSALGIMWVSEGGSGSSLGTRYQWPLFFLAMALLIDFLQYIFLGTYWSHFVMKNDTDPETRKSLEEVESPDWPAIVGMTIWYFKTAVFALGFVWFIVLLPTMSKPR
jgi:hypothetical protein